MRLFYYTLLIAALGTAAIDSVAQEQKKFSFNGAERSLFYADNLGLNGEEADTVTVPRLNSGHVLVDLGLNIRPNQNTEILGMVRIRNDYGGFWGSGVTFDIRQLSVKGVIGGVVRYQLGDINYRMSKYTMWNYDQELMSNIPVAFRQQVDVINYDHFYFNDNSRRQQGAAAECALVFRKYVKELQFHAMTSRVKASDFANVSDRLFSGLNAQLIQSDHLEIGINYANLYDIPGTSRTDFSFRNPVTTFTMKALATYKGIDLSINAEAGKSRTRYENNVEAPDWNDRFLTAEFSAHHKNSGLKISANSMFVGSGFRSPGAQTKRIAFDGTPAAFERFTNDQVLRAPVLLDYMRESDFYTLQLQPYLMPFNPVYDNITPYGDATPNRQGVILTLGYEKKDVPVTAALTHYQLQEERGEGTLLPRKFGRNQLNIGADVNQFFNGWKKHCHVTFSMRNDRTTRGGDELVRGVDLKTDVWNAGIELEVLNGFDLMFGIQSLQYEGFDFTAVRDLYSEIYNFVEYRAEGEEQLTSFGARYRFSEKSFISAQFTSSENTSKVDNGISYDINQFMLLFNMKF